jgi:hypothetical protein
MNRSFLHMNRGSLQMFSGAAGLIAAFAAISLPMLAWPAATPGYSFSLLASHTMVTVVVLTIALATVALMLLRFSLSNENQLRTFHSVGLNGGEQLPSHKVR